MRNRNPCETPGPALADAPDPLSLQPDLTPAPPSAGALAVQSAALPPALAEEEHDEPATLTPYIDENGFDPADYKWVPVRRRPRKDGWSEARQRTFIEVLADTACVETAARAVGLSVQSAYALRRAPGGEAFAAAWNAAIQQGALKLVDVAFDRAIHGSDEPVFDRDGNRTGRRMRQNDRLLMFLLRAHLPDRYRYAHRAVRTPDEPPPPEAEPLAHAIARLEPAAPADPHALMPPEEFDVAIEVADMGDGELPHWYRDREEEPAPVDAKFERDLEYAKAGIWPPPEHDDDDDYGDDYEDA